jgi:hypothetical protein
LISRQPGAKNPHEAYWYYYEENELQAVTTSDGDWKLQFPHTYHTVKVAGKDGNKGEYMDKKIEKEELYDLVKDISETTDVSAEHPEIVKQLEAEAAKARAELGDALTVGPGPGLRDPGHTDKPTAK